MIFLEIIQSVWATYNHYQNNKSSTKTVLLLLLTKTVPKLNNTGTKTFVFEIKF